MPKKLSPEQARELAKCYMLWCGVGEGDDVTSELAFANTVVKDILAHWGEPIPKDANGNIAPEPPIWKGNNR